MAKMHKPGAKVKAKTSHVAVTAGQKGHVATVHHGTFYGVNMGKGMAYMPAANLDPDNDGDVDQPGQPDVDAPPSGPTKPSGPMH